MSTSPDPLDSLLNRWRSTQPPPPAPDTLNREIWRRIADAESLAEPTCWARVEAVFRQPAFAGLFVAACAMFGLFLAEVRVSQQQAERNLQLAHAYIRLIDPLLEQPATAPAVEPQPRIRP